MCGVVEVSGGESEYAMLQPSGILSAISSPCVPERGREGCRGILWEEKPVDSS